MTTINHSSRRVEIVPYNPAWPHQFAHLAGVLACALGSSAVRIEHVGSTSVPGLNAKPILDIDVVIYDTPSAFPTVCEKLTALGYTHSGDLGIPGREAFGRGDDATVPRDGSGYKWPSHHLYVCRENSRELARHLLLRNTLRTDPNARDNYAALKRDLARRFEYDMDSYIDGKTAFIEGIYQLPSRKRRG